MICCSLWIVLGSATKVELNLKLNCARAWDLDQPLHIQFLSYVGNLLRFDFGDSLYSRKPIVDELYAPLPGDAWN